MNIKEKLIKILTQFRLIKMRVDTFYINKKTGQISFIVNYKQKNKYLEKFNPVYADVYFQRDFTSEPFKTPNKDIPQENRDEEHK